MKRKHPPNEDAVKARRILWRLLIDDGDDMLRTVIPKHNVWVSAETATLSGTSNHFKLNTTYVTVAHAHGRAATAVDTLTAVFRRIP